MDSKSPLAKILVAAVAVAISAVLFYFGTGLNPLWPLPWFAPIPILAFASRSAARNTFVAAFLAYFIGGLNVWHFFRRVLDVPLPNVLLFTMLPALLFALIVLAWRRLLLLERFWAATFSLPLLWAAGEYLNAITSPHSTYGSIAYTQMNLLPLIQIASVMGIWGISFILFLVPSSIGALASANGNARSKLKIATAISVIFATVLFFGAWRLRAPQSATGFARIRMLSSSVRTDNFPHEDAKALDLVNRYVDQFTSPLLSGASSPTRPEIVMLPEKIARFSREGSIAARSRFSAAAANQGVNLLVGLDEISNGQHRNDALFFTLEGNLAANYEKHHFIPGLEDGYVLGNDYQIFQQPSGVWGTAICKDMDFPGMAREYGKRGAGLLLVPAWDFGYDAWLHARMAILRGVESGLTIARDAKQGRLTISDNRGRILAEEGQTAASFAIIDTILPVAHESTIYTRFGDWFAWLCLTGSTCVFVMLFFKKRDS